MNKYLLLLVVFSLLSCSVTYKKDKKSPEKTGPTKEELQEQARLKALSDQTKWQHQYYEEVKFYLKNPSVVDSAEKLDGICNGGEFRFSESYQFKPLTAINFKNTPITIKTNSGFIKKAYITKGACRELALFKKQKGNSDQLRQSIESMTLLYVYNVGTYLVDTTFKTKFKDVQFFVR